jgi:hypothetical protein
MKVGLWINDGEEIISFDKAEETESAEVFIEVSEDRWEEMVKVSEDFHQQEFLLHVLYDEQKKKQIAKKKGEKK